MTFHRKCLHRIDLLWLAVAHLFREDSGHERSKLGNCINSAPRRGTSRTSSQRDYLYWWSPITYYTMIIMSRSDESSTRGGVAINYCSTPQRRSWLEDEAAEEIDFPPFGMRMGWEELALHWRGLVATLIQQCRGIISTIREIGKLSAKYLTEPFPKRPIDYSKDSSGWSRATAQFTREVELCPSPSPGEMIDLFAITILAKCLWLWKKAIFSPNWQTDWLTIRTNCRVIHHRRLR